tara:strand:+ start:168 stop:512 length:345 start_codon:yes stop_codon:yes gene_type:complete
MTNILKTDDYRDSVGLDRIPTFITRYGEDNPILPLVKRIESTIKDSDQVLHLTRREVSIITSALYLHENPERVTETLYTGQGEPYTNPWWLTDEEKEDLEWKINILTLNIPDSW